MRVRVMLEKTTTTTTTPCGPIHHVFKKCEFGFLEKNKKTIKFL
jgi:hypothetical protein